MIRGRQIRARSFPAALFFLGLIFIAAPLTRAGAGQASDLLDCSFLRQTIQQPNGAIVGMGNTDDCKPGSNEASPWHWTVLVGLHADGSIRNGFANGGVKLIQANLNEYVWKILGRPGGGFYMYSDQRIWSFSADGAPIKSFGQAGILDVTAPGQMNASGIFDVSVARGGGLFVAARQNETLKPIVGHYGPSGHLLAGFADNGATGTLEVGYNAAVSEDNEGRVVVFGVHAVTRLTPDGEIDTTFGPDNDGYAPMPSGLPYSTDWIYGLTVHEDNSITGYVEQSPGYYIYPGFAVSLDSDGIPVSGSSVVSIGEKLSSVTPSGDGLVFGVFPGRGESQDSFRVGASSWPYSRDYELSPGSGTAYGVTELSDGSILAAGSSDGPDCLEFCTQRSRLALVKIDADTGDPVHSFGSQGQRLIPSNVCRWGQGGTVGDWNLCRVRPPVITGLVSFSRTNSNRPALRLSASLGDPPAGLVGTRQKLTVDLPRKLRLLPGGLKDRVSVSVVPFVESTVKVRGKRITIVAKPEYDPRKTAAESTAQDSMLTFRITIKKGALARIARPRLLYTRVFRLGGEFVPVVNGSSAPGGGPWLSPNSSHRRASAPVPAP